MTQIDLASQSFMVTHLALGYRQLKISKEDTQLFGFLLEDGVYRCARKPKIFINSGHRFINIVTRLVVELELTMEVDDMLIKGDVRIKSLRDSRSSSIDARS